MNIDSSYIGNYGVDSLNQTSLERIGTALEINKASDNSAGLEIVGELRSEQNALSQSLKNMNSGIAMSNIAQSGLSSQQELLENIKTETLKAMNGTMNEDDKNIVAQQINKYIEEFDAISQSTSYNGTSLLQTKNDSSDDISIVDERSTIELEKSDTSSISESLKALMGDFTTNLASQTSLLNTVDQGINQINSFASDFGSASNAMMSSASNSISTEKEYAQSQSTVMDIDYSNEVSSFSKTNLMSQVGLMMQSQANAMQGRSIALLSY